MFPTTLAKWLMPQKFCGHFYLAGVAEILRRPLTGVEIVRQSSTSAVVTNALLFNTSRYWTATQKWNIPYAHFSHSLAQQSSWVTRNRFLEGLSFLLLNWAFCMDLLLNVYRFVSVSVYYVYRICMNFYGFVDFKYSSSLVWLKRWLTTTRAS